MGICDLKESAADRLLTNENDMMSELEKLERLSRWVMDLK